MKDRNQIETMAEKHATDMLKTCERPEGMQTQMYDMQIVFLKEIIKRAFINGFYTGFSSGVEDVTEIMSQRFSKLKN